MKLRIFSLGSLGLLGMLALAAAGTLRAQDQEAASGFQLSTTASGETLASPMLSSSGNNWAATAAFRDILYPTWKISQDWSVTGSVETFSAPYFFNEQGVSPVGLVKVQLLQATLNYSHFWGNRSITLRAGQLSTAFGSFMLRYDDTANPLIDMPQTYGYYWDPVSIDGMAGDEVDATLGKVDMRGQLTNSSPSNPQSIASSYQYLNWTVGGGYTIVQGLRVGASMFRGPYIDGDSMNFTPETSPARLPATGIGADVEWGHGRWNVYGEWQRFEEDNYEMPNFTEEAAYGEARFVVSPRWYLAARLGTVSPNAASGIPQWQTYEAAVGFRPGAHELVKVEYEIQQWPGVNGPNYDTLALQFVTNLRLLSFAGSSR